MRVLVIGPDWIAGSTESVARAFTACGCAAQAVKYAYWFPVAGVRRLGSWWRRLHAPSANRRAEALTHDAVMRAADEHGCDLAFVVIGSTVAAETIVALKQRFAAKTALWLMDDPLLAWTDPPQMQPLPYAAYDRVYLFDSYHLPQMCAHFGDRFSHLPLAFDETVYQALPRADKKYRAVFIGEAFAERRELLTAVPEVEVDTWCGDFSGLANCRVHAAVPPEETNVIYNAAAVVINRNHRQSIYGNNLRVFEATGSGACLLTDAKAELVKLFVPGEEALVYGDRDEFRGLLIRYSNDPAAAAVIGMRAAARARAEHTFTHRVRTVLADLT